MPSPTMPSTDTMPMHPALAALREQRIQQDAERRSTQNQTQDAPLGTQRIPALAQQSTEGCLSASDPLSEPPVPKPPVSVPKPVRKKALASGAAKMLRLLKEAERVEVATPAECTALHTQLQKTLQAMDPHDRQACLKELEEHHQVEYPTETEGTYHAVVESATAFAAGREGLRVTVHAAAGGALGGLLRDALPGATITQSDINPKQSPEVTDISEGGIPLLDGGEPAKAATYDFATARNSWYSPALSFVLLRAMLHLLKPGGRVCITCTRAQAPRAG